MWRKNQATERMTVRDARFEDANDEPLRLRIIDSDDLVVASALLQDAVFSAADLSRDGSRREYSMLLNRFRWEYRAATSKFERVRCVLMICDVLGVESDDLPREGRTFGLLIARDRVRARRRRYRTGRADPVRGQGDQTGRGKPQRECDRRHAPLHCTVQKQA